MSNLPFYTCPQTQLDSHECKDMQVPRGHECQHDKKQEKKKEDCIKDGKKRRIERGSWFEDVVEYPFRAVRVTHKNGVYITLRNYSREIYSCTAGLSSGFRDQHCFNKAHKLSSNPRATICASVGLPGCSPLDALKAACMWCLIFL